MRLVIALVSATGVWATSCSVSPPCAVLRPGLTVLLAEVMETHSPSTPGLVKMKVRSLAYGRSPGAEFTYPVHDSE